MLIYTPPKITKITPTHTPTSTMRIPPQKSHTHTHTHKNTHLHNQNLHKERPVLCISQSTRRTRNPHSDTGSNVGHAHREAREESGVACGCVGVWVCVLIFWLLFCQGSCIPFSRPVESLQADRHTHTQTHTFIPPLPATPTHPFLSLPFTYTHTHIHTHTHTHTHTHSHLPAWYMLPQSHVVWSKL
jgi:hypothetical protein